MTSKGTIRFERSYRASIEDVWALWTTKKGFESWWGPEGFETKVIKLELEIGGELRYAMTATAPVQIEFMRKAGMPLSQEAGGRFTEVVPLRRLVLVQRMDFIQGVEPYETTARVDLEASGDSVKMTLTLDALHSEDWTKRAAMGWESQLGKLSRILPAAKAAPAG